MFPQGQHDISKDALNPPSFVSGTIPLRSLDVNAILAVILRAYLLWFGMGLCTHADRFSPAARTIAAFY